MNMDQSAVFLAGSVLTILGFIVVVVGIVVINNILHKYWKPVSIFTKDSFSPFGGHSYHDPMQNLSQDEYQKLIKHLDEIRNPDPKIDKTSV